MRRIARMSVPIRAAFLSTHVVTAFLCDQTLHWQGIWLAVTEG
jgi:hypothetical protein